ncbi:hypothetical protein ACEPAF_8822 [Sanghuangporus sanghuang]
MATTTATYTVQGKQYDVEALHSDSEIGRNAQISVEKAMARAESCPDDDASTGAAIALFDLAKVRKELKADNAKLSERLTGTDAQLASVLAQLASVRAELAIVRKDQEAQGSQMAEDRQDLRAKLEIVENRLVEYSCVSQDVEEYIVYGRKGVYFHMLRRQLIDGIRLTFTWGAYLFLNEFIRFFLEPEPEPDVSGIKNWTLSKLWLSPIKADPPKEVPKPAPPKSPSGSYAHVARASVSSASAISDVTSPSGSASSKSKHLPGSAIAKNAPIGFSKPARSLVVSEGSTMPDAESRVVPTEQHHARYFRHFNRRGRIGPEEWTEFWDNKLARYGVDMIATSVAAESNNRQKGKDKPRDRKSKRTFQPDQFDYWRLAMWQFMDLLKEDLYGHPTRSQTPTLTSTSAASRLAKLPFHKKKGKEERDKEEREKEKREREKREEEEEAERKKTRERFSVEWVNFARRVYNKHAKGFTRERKKWVLDRVVFARVLLSNGKYFQAVCIDVDQLRELGNEAVHNIAFPLEVDRGEDHDWIAAIDQVDNLPRVDNPATAQLALHFAYKLMKNPHAIPD